MNATVLRAAVVGVGAFGLRHAAHWAALEGARLAGVYDAEPARARAAALALGCAALRDLGEVAALADVVSVAVPTPRHADVAAALLERGAHVLVEKPLATTSGDAAALVALARARRRVLEVGFVERFNPAVRGVQAYGVRPRLVQATRLGPFPQRARDVDVVLDWMIHDLDLCLHLCGVVVERVEAAGASVAGAPLDAATARVHLAAAGGGAARGAAVCDLTAVRLSPDVRRVLRVVEADAVWELDLARRSAVVVRPGLAPAPVPVPVGDPLREELRAFAAACRGEVPPAVGAEAGRRALDLALRVRAAAAPRPFAALRAV